MPRQPRLIFPDALYHLTVRGNNQQKIFKNIADRFKYLRTLIDCKREFEFKLYSLVMMPNHVHLFISPNKKFSISIIMKKLNQTYTQYFNWKNRRSGHLFQGRFFSRIIDKESYFLEVSRYIHINPCVAGLCQNPEDYRWSSYQVYCGKAVLKDMEDLIDRDEFLKICFGQNLTLEEKMKEYQTFIKEGLRLKADYFGKLARKLKIVD